MQACAHNLEVAHQSQSLVCTQHLYTCKTDDVTCDGNATGSTTHPVSAEQQPSEEQPLEEQAVVMEEHPPDDKTWRRGGLPLLVAPPRYLESDIRIPKVTFPYHHLCCRTISLRLLWLQILLFGQSLAQKGLLESAASDNDETKKLICLAMQRVARR